MSTTSTATLADFLLARIDDDEAKRWIAVELLARDTDVDLMLGPNTTRQREWVGLRLAARLLAVPYADHPDYRDEWRP